MNTECTHNLSSLQVCEWIDAHPDFKIIAIASSNWSIEKFIIFYQRP